MRLLKKHPQAVSVLLLILLSAAMPCGAHEVPSSKLLVDVIGDSIAIELHMPLSELSAAIDRPLTQNPTLALGKYRQELRQYAAQHLFITDDRGQLMTAAEPSLALEKTNNENWVSNDWLVATMQFSAPANHARQFAIHCDVIVHQVVNHNILASLRRDFTGAKLDTESSPLGLLGYQQTVLSVQLDSGSWWRGFKGMIKLGAHHIAVGADHLLFLITLLLPAPLVASASVWQTGNNLQRAAINVIKTVSGFTLGHSLTLALAALGWVVAPTQPVEILIAVSIMFAAIHACRPLFAGKEIFIAIGFGLIHGLAFAQALAGFNYNTQVLVTALLGFNLGIELMQLGVVLAVLPLLIIWSYLRSYVLLRTLIAGLAFIASWAWVMERAWNLPNPFNVGFNWIIGHALPCWCAALLITTLAYCQQRLQYHRHHTANQSA